jgi:hypothetical protein
MTDYYELAQLADRIFSICNDNMDRLVEVLLSLDPDIRNELIFSDFMNAYQVFYYFFREAPTELAKERLILEHSTSVESGVLVEERELLELIFTIRDNIPVILVFDGDVVLHTFSGSSAYRDAVAYAEEI